MKDSEIKKTVVFEMTKPPQQEAFPPCKVWCDSQKREIYASDGRQQAQIFVPTQDLEQCARWIFKILNEAKPIQIDIADLKQWEGWQLSAYAQVGMLCEELENISEIQLPSAFRQAQAVLFCVMLPEQAGLTEVVSLSEFAMKALKEDVNVLFTVGYDPDIEKLTAVFLGFEPMEE